MRPVRVSFPGLAATFPLRMVAAGAASNLGIVLWVIADQRYAAMNYDTTTIDESKLRWSNASNKSNYRQVFEQTIAAHGGRALVTEYAQPFYRGALPGDAAGDVTVAMVGQGATVTLTRLRTSISPRLLDQDLILVPSETNAQVSNQHFLRAEQLTSDPVSSTRGGDRLPMAFAALSVLAALVVRRRRVARA